MRVFQQGLGYRSRSQLAVGIEDVAALVDAPAVVGSPFHQIDLFPEVLSVVAHPEMPGPGVHRHAPGVAKPVGPGFGAGPLHAGERIVRGHRVETPRVRAVDVDPKHLGKQMVQSLSLEISVRIAGPVAGGDVHQVLGTEGDGCAVVSVGLPFDDHLGRVGVKTVGRLAVYPIAGDANALAAVPNPVVAADEEVAVLLEGGMKGDAVGQGFPEMVQDLRRRRQPVPRWSGTAAAPLSWGPGRRTTTCGSPAPSPPPPGWSARAWGRLAPPGRAGVGPGRRPPARAQTPIGS